MGNTLLRALIGTVLAGGIIIFGFFVFFQLQAQKEPPEKKEKKKTLRPVSTKTVKKDREAIYIPITGRLNPADKIELYAEVTGILQKGRKPFKIGIRYKKGETLLQLNNDEAFRNLQSRRSSLLNSIVQMMPDIKMDYAENEEAWQEYINNFSVNQRTPSFPEPKSKEERYFLISRNIYQQYYDIKSLEEQLAKYTLTAPFSGVLTEAETDPGTLVRNGQKLGEFIRTGVYELETAVSAGDLNLVDEGDTTYLSSTDHPGKWKGTITRINQRVESNTQAVKIFIQIKSKDLKAGMYMNGRIHAGTVKDAVTLNRKKIMDGSYVWIVKDGVLKKQQITVIHAGANRAVVRGLESGMELPEQSIPSAYEGMPVRVVKDTSTVSRDTTPASRDTSTAF